MIILEINLTIRMLTELGYSPEDINKYFDVVTTSHSYDEAAIAIGAPSNKSLQERWWAIN